MTAYVEIICLHLKVGERICDDTTQILSLHQVLSCYKCCFLFWGLMVSPFKFNRSKKKKIKHARGKEITFLQHASFSILVPVYFSELSITVAGYN